MIAATMEMLQRALTIIDETIDLYEDIESSDWALAEFRRRYDIRKLLPNHQSPLV